MTGVKKFKVERLSSTHLKGLNDLLNEPTVAHWLGKTHSWDSIESSIEKDTKHWQEHEFETRLRSIPLLLV